MDKNAPMLTLLNKMGKLSHMTKETITNARFVWNQFLPQANNLVSLMAAHTAFVLSVYARGEELMINVQQSIILGLVQFAVKQVTWSFHLTNIIMMVSIKSSLLKSTRQL